MREEKVERGTGWREDKEGGHLLYIVRTSCCMGNPVPNLVKYSTIYLTFLSLSLCFSLSLSEDIRKPLDIYDMLQIS
jgi:hypothetical protein